MSRFCPIVNKKITYQFCEDCEDKPCKKGENMNTYTIAYSHGGREETIKADSPLKALEKGSRSAGVKMRFYKTSPSVEPKYFTVTDTKTGKSQYYKGIPIDA